MRTLIAAAVFTLAVVAVCGSPLVLAAQTPASQPQKTIAVPTDYREWVYMTSGLDMTYAAAGAVGLTAEHKSVFDNVFVNPEAWRAFKQTGIWPDGTTFILENRAAQQNVSINKGGHTQSSDVSGVEIHQKRNGDWAFYVRGNDGAEHLVAKPASCYTCHEAHAAVDTTFAQFYPTAFPIAKAKNTVSAEYLKELDAPPAK